MKTKASPKIHLPLLVGLLILTILYRWGAAHFSFLGNTAPLMAVCFGGALLLGARFWWLPILLLVGSDLFLGLTRGTGVGNYTLMSAGFYAVVAFVASRFGQWSGRTWPALWCGTLLASVGFYVFANTFSWMVSPEYAKSIAGWWQSQTTGLPQYSPQAWVFLRNALIADTIWCVIAGLLFFRKSAPAEPVPAR